MGWKIALEAASYQGLRLPAYFPDQVRVKADFRIIIPKAVTDFPAAPVIVRAGIVAYHSAAFPN
jgi:hypothetical protein